MEYDDDDGVAEGVPKFGAIFMTSALTKKECFRHKIFALPHSQAEFVKKIKAGMVLFLFEFKKRQLFGVYQASSDGAMNIVPHAFSNSGKRYPAQVRFTTIWYCEPLSEKEFKNAIIENYYSAKKFTWGLSEQQVHNLVFLFSSRKMRNEMVPRPVGKDRRSAGADIFGLSERGYKESTENNEFNPAAFSDHHTHSFVEEDEVLLDDRVQGDFLAKKRRIDLDARLLENDMDELYNNGSLQNFHNDSPMDSLDEILEFISVLVVVSGEVAEKELVRLGAVKRVLELFFDYPFNNFLHYHVEHIISSCLESKNPQFVKHLFHDCNLIGRILEGEKNFSLAVDTSKPTTTAVEGRPPARLGNIGHITRIANKLVQLGNCNSEMQTFAGCLL